MCNFFEIENFDFFSETEEDFYNKEKTESVLVQGRHWDSNPLITVIITTYKRVDLLDQALRSALNQEAFANYQIVVADNEGANLDVLTETAEYMRRYANNDKVIYYRHKKSVQNKMDAAVKLVRSEWIVFLHDDDLLVKNHLVVMSKIISENENISYISAPAKVFSDYISVAEYEELVKPATGRYTIVSYPSYFLCTGFVPGWLGAMIKREKYIQIGGMPKIATGIGDFIMQGKFVDRWQAHVCRANEGLYCYRQWTGQASSNGTDFWMKCYRNEYLYYKYLISRYHKHFCKFWERTIAYIVLQKCEEKNKSYYKLNIDTEKMKEQCEIDNKIKLNGIQFWIDTKMFTLYKIIVMLKSRLFEIKGQF